ncbi:restriction endonuclease subunit S [Aquibacillus rhizosphaerae]|uniref:Restriction endonuclease subunit S n=1 Tax=Aquibacillus rhizosphaerae TaxID=3051431 RepID=A0ABT7L3A0_9BACI|nr:restriction endonuclease subunit S [Aquibacillus sp. LR5S19]MDL4840342.1 restriction endonuclease subunit S [Aquibacillus sp. LR5S19]
MEKVKNSTAYKGSGIEWLGNVPTNWSIKKIKYIAKIIDGDRGTEYPNDKNLVNEGIPFLSGENLNERGLTFNKVRYITEEKFSRLRQGKLKNGDLIVSVRGTIGSAGLFVISKYKTAFINAQMMIIRPKQCLLLPRYLFYYTRTKAWFNCLDFFAYGTAQKQLSNKVLSNIEIAIPSIENQREIVKFLDEKTSKIDLLITDKEKLIELLEEKRQAIITEAVTKGLNPDMKMKNSGVDWIGEIPEHWEKNKVKYSTYVKGRIGWQGLRSDEFIDEGPYLVTGTDFVNGLVNWNTCYHISEERFNEAPAIQLKENDLLITKDGTIGKVATVKNKPEKAILNSGIFVTRCSNEKYLTEYMYWVLSSNIFDRYIKYMETGSTIKHLYQETFVNFTYPLPGIDEQKAIVKYLNEITNDIDFVISDTRSQIEKVKEYRQSLIYEAVTGKIDLRNYKGEEV